MAIGGVVINFALKTRDAVKDALRLTNSLEDVSDEARQLDGTLGKTERAIDTAGTAARNMAGDLEPAERGFEQLATEVRQSADDMRREMGRMSGAVQEGARDVDRETGKMRQDMGEAGRETGSEFIGNIAEGIGSGQANLADVVSGTLGGLTNLAASLTGPVGVAAGAAAAGIGLVFSKVRAEAEDAQARLDSMRGALEDVGDEGKEVARAAVFKQWITDAQKTTGKIEQVRDGLARADVSADDFQDALAGDPKAVQRVLDKVRGIEDGIYQAYLNQGYLTEEQQATKDAMKTVRDEVTKTDAAVGAVRREQDAIEQLTEGTYKKTKKVEGAWSGVADETQKARDDIEAIDGRQVDVNVKWKESARPGGLPGGKSMPPPATGPTPHATTTIQPVQPATVIVTEEQIYRAITSLIMRGDARNGRVRIA